MKYYMNEPLTVFGTDGNQTIANLNDTAIILPCVTRKCEFGLIQYGEPYSIVYEGSEFTTLDNKHYLAIKLKGKVIWDEVIT